jgi:hypothetical protein
MSKEPRERVHRKAGELLRRYGIRSDAPECWAQLADALTREFPGFRQDLFRSRGGRPSDWNPISLWLLWLAVRDVRRKKACSVASACNILAGRGLWSSRSGAGLRSAYRHTKHSPFVRLIEQVEAQLGPDNVDRATTHLLDHATLLEMLNESRAVWPAWKLAAVSKKPVRKPPR